MTDLEWLRLNVAMCEDGLKEACLAYWQLPSDATIRHLRNRLAEVETAIARLLECKQ